jgi:hypothetical protein
MMWAVTAVAAAPMVSVTRLRVILLVIMRRRRRRVSARIFPMMMAMMRVKVLRRSLRAGLRIRICVGLVAG